MTDFKTLNYAVEDKVGVLSIHRPEALNALNKQVIADLNVALQSIAGQRDTRVLIITGSGEKSFVAGADIKEMENISPAQAKEMAVLGQAVMQKIEDLPIPVIAAVNGFALGGGLEMALACDFIIASSKAKWGLPEVSLGLIPGYGGTQRLVRNIGRARAKRVALSGEMFTAEIGERWGMFVQVTAPEELLSTAKKMAGVLASRAPQALAWVKEAISQGDDCTLADGLKLEAELFSRTFTTLDKKEGIAAFLEKRSAQFSGN